MAGIAVIILAFLADDTARDFLRIGDNPALYQFARKASLAGEGWVIALAGVVLTPIFLLARRPAAARMVAIVVLAGLIAGAGGTLVRTLTGRTRPKAHAPQGFYGVRYEGKFVAGRHEFSSFPSGHASTVAGFAWAVWLLNRRLGLAACLYAAIVCWSRVAQSAHHFSDVVAGTVFGMVAACLVVRFIGPWVDRAITRLERKPATA
jgi:membrane-associated phospholipid phosphatase